MFVFKTIYATFYVIFLINFRILIVLSLNCYDFFMIIRYLTNFIFPSQWVEHVMINVSMSLIGGIQMKFRTLGKTGFKISEVSLGTWQLGGKWGDSI